MAQLIVLLIIATSNAFEHPSHPTGITGKDDDHEAWFESHKPEVAGLFSGQTAPQDFVREEDTTDDFCCDLEGIQLNWRNCHDLMVLIQMMTTHNPLTETAEYMGSTDLGTGTNGGFIVESHAGIQGLFMGSDIDETGPTEYEFTNDIPPLLRKIKFERSQELNDRGDGVAKGSDHLHKTLILLGICEHSSSSDSNSLDSSDSSEIGFFAFSEGKEEKQSDLWHAKNEKCIIDYNLLMDYVRYGILISFIVFVLLMVVLIWCCCKRGWFGRKNRKISVDSVSTSPKQYISHL